MIMDPFTKKVLWDFWNMINNYEGVADEDISDVKKANNDEEQETAKIFKIETNLFDYETPLCTEFKKFNFLLRVDPELFTHDIKRTKTYEEYENKLNDELEEPWSEDGDYEWYNELTDGNLKEDALKQKVIYEKSWGNTSQSEMNFCAWLKRSFGNFHELDYELLIKLQDYWWKVNNRECSPFSYWMNYIQGPYANYYRNILDKEEHEDEERCELFDDQERPVCNIKRFEMIKYSFRKDEEYVVVKENEYDDLTSTSKETRLGKCECIERIPLGNSLHTTFVEIKRLLDDLEVTVAKVCVTAAK
ncbi:hypothetical protein Tco_1145169 [Tanacetum coccineum]